MLKKCVALVVILLLISVSVIPSTGRDIVQSSISPFHNGNTLYVGGDGPNNYTRIQDAINDSSDGDTVFVYNGTYYENIEIINKSINMIGEYKNKTIIDGCQLGDVIRVYSHRVTIKYLTIQNSSQDIFFSGIMIGDFYNDMSYNDSNISNNNIVNNGNGIVLSEACFSIISNNNISYNKGMGISLEWGSNENLIQENIISYNGYGGWYHGIFIILLSNKNRILRNKIFKNEGQGILIGGSNNEISYNQIYSNGENGIIHGGGPLITYNLLINWNNIHKNGKNGIYISGAPFSQAINVRIIHNNITSNLGRGIKLQCTYFSRIKYNNIAKNIINAEFHNSFLIKWYKNYWGLFGKIIKPIIGFLHPFLMFNPFIFVPMLDFDFRPAKEPYDIGV